MVTRTDRVMLQEQVFATQGADGLITPILRRLYDATDAPHQLSQIE